MEDARAMRLSFATAAFALALAAPSASAPLPVDPAARPAQLVQLPDGRIGVPVDEDSGTVGGTDHVDNLHNHLLLVQ